MSAVEAKLSLGMAPDVSWRAAGSAGASRAFVVLAEVSVVVEKTPCPT